MGVDLAYYRLQTASAGAIVNYSQLAGSAQPSGLRTVADQEAFAWPHPLAPRPAVVGT